MILKSEEKYLHDAIMAARSVQEFLWGEANDKWTLEEWKRMFKKRWHKLDEINQDNPHAMVELRKRVLQNAALSIALLALLEEKGLAHISTIPSNLPQFATCPECGSTKELHNMGCRTSGGTIYEANNGQD